MAPSVDAGPGEAEERPPIRREEAASSSESESDEDEDDGEDDGSSSDDDGEEEEEEEASDASGNGSSSGSDEEDEGEEEEEEMPILKYHRMKAHAQAVLGGGGAQAHDSMGVEVTAVCLHPRCLIVGTSEGTVHLLDYQGGGQELARVPAHSRAAGAAAAVRCISIDDSGEFVASCSDAGTVVVFSVSFSSSSSGSGSTTAAVGAGTTPAAASASSTPGPLAGAAGGAAAARSSSSSSSSSSSLTAATGMATAASSSGASKGGGGGGSSSRATTTTKAVTAPGVSIGAEQVYSFTWKGGRSQPLHAVHLDPAHRRRTEKAFLCGGEAGQLVMARKGFFSYRDEVLHEGEGPVRAIAWRGSLVAWANDEGVKVLDVESQERISFVERPEVEGPVGALRVSLLWERDGGLLIGWYDTVLLLQIKPRASVTPQQQQQPTRLGEITLRWRTDCVISGLFPFDADSLAVLGYVNVLEEEEEDASDSEEHSATPLSSSSAASRVVCRAELQLRARATGQVFSAEVLPLEGEDRVRDPRDYLLASSVALTCKKAPGPGLWRLPRGLVAKQPAQPSPPRKQQQHPASSSPSSSSGGGGAALSSSSSAAAIATTAGESFAPVMLIAAPRDLLVARVRTVDDRILWELRRGDLGAAIQLALLNRHLLTQQRFHALATAYLEQLMERGDYLRAAAECPRLLGDDSALWERWIYAFASKGQLAALTAFVPLQRPRLSRSTYEMVLYSLLDRGEHAALLATLRRWGSRTALVPQQQQEGQGQGQGQGQVYDVGEAARRVAVAAAASPDPRLLEALALLQQLQGRVEAALRVYWDLFRLLSSTPEEAGGAYYTEEERAGLFAPVFRLIEEHGLFDAAATRVPTLLRMDREAAGEMLLRYVDRFPIPSVVRQLQQQEEEAAGLPGGDGVGGSPMKKQQVGGKGRGEKPQPQGRKQGEAEASALLLWYLHLLFQRFPEQYNAPEHRDLHRLQVELYAASAPPFRPATDDEEGEEESESGGEYRSDLLAFLQWSNHVELETALAACERRRPPLYDEEVYILGRIGHTREALAILLEKIGSVGRAIAFVERHDKALWQDLTAFSLQHPRFLAGLLRHAGEYHVDLARELLRDIPDGMAIPGLRDTLLGIVASYRFERTLHEGCQAVAQRDWVAATRRFHHAQRRAVRIDVPQAACHGCGKPLAGPAPLISPAHVPARAEGGVNPERRHVFACRHVYHDACCWATERSPPPLMPLAASSDRGAAMAVQYAFRCETCRAEAFYALSSRHFSSSSGSPVVAAGAAAKAGGGRGGGRR